MNQAKSVQTLADAHLKSTQAEALGGPDKVPDTPTGLNSPMDVADVADKFAGASLKRAQAAHLEHSMALKHTETHADIAHKQQTIELARQQFLHDRQTAGNA